MSQAVTQRAPRDGADLTGQLTQLWERNLGVPIAARDDYFARGGDSLLGTQLLALIHQAFGIELSLLDLFESRTLDAQVHLLEARLHGAAPSDKPTTEYHYFGPPGIRLFGALHRPANPATTGVVLCAPMGQEYMRLHRTYVELARSLAAAGYGALRFDYLGCGDSSGEATAGDLDAWTADIRHALDELQARTQVRRRYAVGARVGANLVLRVAASADLDGVVLWDPIVRGTDYLVALRRAHHELLRGNAELAGYDARALPGDVLELLGFPITPRLYEQVAALELDGPAAAVGAPALVLASTPKAALERFVTDRRQLGAIEYVTTGESDAIWLAEDRQNKGVIPARAVQAIVSWIARRTG